MRNPLFKRHKREFLGNLGKYVGIFLMMTFAVSFTSGFLLAAGSIETIVGDMKETYRIEDGRFACDFEPGGDALAAVRDLGVTLYPDFYKQVDTTLEGGDNAGGITCRVYPTRSDVNLPAYAQGRAPASPNEIALDRVFCENHELEVGNIVRLNDSEFTVCGIVTLPDYQALFENNNSFMFNALTFTVAIVDPAGYKDLENAGEVYNYAFVFDDQGLTQEQRTDVEERMMDALSDHDASLSNFIDAADNQGIGYALDDVQGDQAMWTVLLFLLVIIMGFVFVVLTSATIEQESAVLGTLLASGWRKRELVRHYMFLPVVVGLLASITGLALGVGVLCDPFKDLYYHSYSLPPYRTIWNARIVLVTAVLPYLLLVGITLVGLLRNLRFTPLQFLRHEAAGRRRNSRLRLPERLRYVTRFRVRVLARNASHFVTLFFGIMFASLLLLFGLCMLPVVDNYAKALRETVAAPHQYVLKTPLELEGTDEDRAAYAAVLRLAQDKERMDANRPAIDALKRLQDNKPLADALERLQDNTELMDAVDRLQSNSDLMDAFRRLRDNTELMDAAQRLQGKQVVANMDSQTRNDLQTIAQANEQARSDLELISNLDDKTRADLELLTKAKGQTKKDLELLTNLDAATQKDVDLVRAMDRDLLDDLRLAADVDEDAHVVNTQINSAATVAQVEKYAMATVEIERAFGGEYEEVTVYGIQPHSVYWTSIPVANGTVVAGRGLTEKTKAQVGEPISMYNRREGDEYEVEIAQEASNAADTDLYMSIDDFNRLFGNDANYFNAYASAEELALDDRYVATSIVPEDMDEISNQMRESMGNIMTMMMLMAVPIYLILLYLLTKTVIDRSARSISYMKVFGYHSREVDGLYIHPITLFVLFSLLASIPLIIALLTGLLKVVFSRYAGNFPINIPPDRLALLVIVGMVAYVAVAALHVRRIRKVPLSLALKAQE